MRRFGRQKGQAAVEAMYAIPVMLLLFSIGCQLWQITWNAQYAHVKARYTVMKDANHMPCAIGDGSGGVTALQTEPTATANATTDEHQFYGGRFLPTARSRSMTAKATLVCKKP